MQTAHSYLKQKRKNAKGRVEEERLAQLDMFRDDYESRVVHEDLLCQRTDALVAKMEKEETEPLNEQLQNTQSVQADHAGEQVQVKTVAGGGTCIDSQLSARGSWSQNISGVYHEANRAADYLGCSNSRNKL